MRAEGIKGNRGTLTSADNSTIESHCRPVVDQKRQEVNEVHPRQGKLFDAVADFDPLPSMPRPRDPAGVPAQQHGRRARRQAASEPGRLCGNGQCGGHHHAWARRQRRRRQ